MRTSTLRTLTRARSVAATAAIAASLAMSSTLTPGVAQAAGTTTTVQVALPGGSMKAVNKTISGTVGGGAISGRTVTLEQRTTSGAWQKVAKDTSNSRGAFSLAAPTWYLGPHTLRVKVAAAGDASQVLSAAKTVKVVPSYDPAGSASSYRLLYPDLKPRWNPCETITYRVNPRNRPTGGLTDIRAALNRVSTATGLRFKYVGETTHVPLKDNKTTFVSNADLSFAWTSPRVAPRLAGSVAGIGGSKVMNYGGPWVIEKGYVVLDTTQLLQRGFGDTDQATRGGLLLHEIGHVMGLDHVSASSQMMYSTITATTARFDAGDLAGLRTLGALGGCR